MLVYEAQGETVPKSAGGGSSDTPRFWRSATGRLTTKGQSGGRARQEASGEGGHGTIRTAEVAVVDVMALQLSLPHHLTRWGLPRRGS